MEKDITKKYSNSEITVIWKPGLCIHSTKCWKGLGEVFKPKERPWINMEGAETDKIIAQVNQCPSGALSYLSNTEAEQVASVEAEKIVEISENGPLLVYGNLLIKSKNGEEKRESKVTAFCRCGGSTNKPYCDGTHRKIGFQG